MNEVIKNNKISGGLKFLIVVLALYLVFVCFDFPAARQAGLNFLLMLIKIVPVLILVFIIMIFVNLYFTKARIGKYLGAESGARGWAYAIVAGILVSGPPYLLFPLLGELKGRGMKNSLLAIFLFNRNVKIPFLPVMVYYFGLGYTIILSSYIIIFSLLNGKMIELLAKRRP